MKKSHRNIPLGHLNVCQICGSDNLQQVINMGFSALCDKEMWEVN